MNQVFFGKEGLTSTSANHVANMAKEYAERIGQEVKTLRLFTQKARLLSDNTELCCNFRLIVLMKYLMLFAIFQGVMHSLDGFAKLLLNVISARRRR